MAIPLKHVSRQLVAISRTQSEPRSEAASALLADAVAILQGRATWLAATGRRVWEPSPDMPALVIIVDEYAGLTDEAPDAMSDTDSIARLGRAVAVTLVAATQRPTQKAMGQDAVRSQMDTRICFRVRKRKDVDLVLGQGMLAAGWHAHTLNAPGKFLLSVPEHTAPRRARAYLVTDDDVARTVAGYSDGRPELDDVSRNAISPTVTARSARDIPRDAQIDAGDPSDATDAYDVPTAEESLWCALCVASGDGTDIGELMRASGMSRPILYLHLNQLARHGRAIQAGWDAGSQSPWERVTMSNCLTQFSRLTPRACLHVNTPTETARQIVRQLPDHSGAGP